MRPHPHIGLAAVTTFRGRAILHRDSLGSVQRIEPCHQLMTAAAAWCIPERTLEDLRGSSATPATACNCGSPAAPAPKNAPGFEHFAADALPSIMVDDVAVRVLIDEAFGAVSLVETPMVTALIRYPAAGRVATFACEPPGACSL